MADNKVKFLRGTSDEYTAAEKDNDTIYFTTDDGKLYIGDKEVLGDRSITIDDALSDTSENPVQNKVVKQAIDSKADKSLYVNSANFTDDSTATAASPVKMTLTRAGSDTNTITANIPKVSSSSAGVVPKGTAVSSQSKTTKFLREDGTWAAPSYTTNTDTKVTSAANHYTPAKSTTKSASGGTLTDITNSTSGTQVVTGVEMDAKGHVTGVTSVALKSTDTKVSVDSSLSSTSINPVQNKIVNSALSKKVDKTSAVFSTYNSVINFGVTNASSPNDIWAAIPDNSIVIVTASTFTHSKWNFPSGYQGSATVVFVKVNTNRLGGIYLVPKTGGYIYWSNVGSDGSYNANWRALMNGRVAKGQASLKAGATKCITNHNFEFLYCLYWTSSAKFDENYAALISVVGDTTSFTINSAYSKDGTIGYIIYGN